MDELNNLVLCIESEAGESRDLNSCSVPGFISPDCFFKAKVHCAIKSGGGENFMILITTLNLCVLLNHIYSFRLHI
jgi:hypothetical protein